MGKDEALMCNLTQVKGQSVPQSPESQRIQLNINHDILCCLCDDTCTLCSVLSAGMVVARGMP